MKIKKIIAGGLIGLSIFAQSSLLSFAGTAYYQIKSGDTYWKISDRYDIDLEELLDTNSDKNSSYLEVGQTILLPYDSNEKILYTVVNGDTYWKIAEKFGISTDEIIRANNAGSNSYLEVGDIVIVPQGNKIHIVQWGETYWKIAEKYGITTIDLLEANNAEKNDYLEVGDEIIIPTGNNGQETTSIVGMESYTNSSSSQPYITYEYYTVKEGDTYWTIANDFGVQVNDLYEANGANDNTVLNIGDTVKIPVYNIPITSTPGEQYGEYLDWWTQAQYVVPIGSVFKITDFYTGKSFMAKRTIGANHSDTETLTAEDTSIYLEIFGGSYSWEKRPVIIEYNGRKIAASMAGMPHAGNENAPAGEYTSWRSGDYGEGTNYDYIKGNNMDGHFDLHFKNSTRHIDGQIDSTHQNNVKIAAGQK